jgi:CRISPR-associated protein Cmr3
VPTAEIVVRETRIGIGMSYRDNTTREGRLYVRDAIRLREGNCLAVGCATPPAELDGEVGRFGGDGRLVRFRLANGVRWPRLPALSGRRLKLYFASPTWLRDGTTRVSWERMLSVYLGSAARIEVAGTAVSSSPMLGGWDLVRQQPREMRRLIGAGSVVFVEVTQGNAAAVAESLHGRTVCDDAAMAAAGFGLAFVGGW